MTKQYKPTPESCAAKIKDHQYTLLAKTETIEAWRARNPGNSAYSFDLVMTRYGIAMYGDTGSLVWGVGSSYGLKFLAGTDDDYVFMKLDENCREKDLDEEALVRIVLDAIYEILTGREVAGQPEWLADTAPIADRIQQLDDWLVAAPCTDGEYGALVVALREVQDLEVRSIEGAHLWLSDHHDLLELSGEEGEDLGKPTNSVMQRIYFARHAAQQILAAAEASAEAAAAPLEYAYGDHQHTEQWSDDGVAAYVGDQELAEGAVIYRGVIHRNKASDYVPDADDIVQHMNERATDESEFADNFPEIDADQVKELDKLMEPVGAWFDRHCSVGFYEVREIQPYTVTAEDVAAAAAYREQRDHFETPAAVIKQIHDHQELKALVEPGQVEPAHGLSVLPCEASKPGEQA